MAKDLSASISDVRSGDTYDLNRRNSVSSYRNTALLVSTILTACATAAIYLVFLGSGAVPIVIGTLLSLLLAALPILVCHVQGTSRERQLARLDSMNDHPVSKTE